MITKRERLWKEYKLRRNQFFRRGAAAVPVLIFGEQRSGTNMLLDCFDRSPHTAVYNETDDDAFVDYELRDMEVIRAIVARSLASHVVFKPTADGNRADEVLDGLPGARAIWIYRDYRDAVSSALALFRETSLEYLSKVATRSSAARWRSVNISDGDVLMIQGHLSRGISEASARALIWFIRNSFLFKLHLNARRDVLVINYEDLVGNPTDVIGRAFNFAGLPFKRSFASKVFASSVGRRPPPDIDPEISAACEALLVRIAGCRHSDTPARPPISLAAGGG